MDTVTIKRVLSAALSGPADGYEIGHHWLGLAEWRRGISVQELRAALAEFPSPMAEYQRAQEMAATLDAHLTIPAEDKSGIDQLRESLKF